MFNIRVATEQDIPTIAKLAFEFWQESPTYSLRSFNIDRVITHLTKLMHGEGGCLFVCTLEDQIIGGFAGGIQSEWQSRNIDGI